MQPKSKRHFKYCVPVQEQKEVQKGVGVGVGGREGEHLKSLFIFTAHEQLRNTYFNICTA